MGIKSWEARTWSFTAGDGSQCPKRSLCLCSQGSCDTRPNEAAHVVPIADGTGPRSATGYCLVGSGSATPTWLFPVTTLTESQVRFQGTVKVAPGQGRGSIDLCESLKRWGTCLSNHRARLWHAYSWNFTFTCDKMRESKLERPGMTDLVAEAQAQWDDFLEKWPLSRLETMSLDEYTNLDRTSFTYDLDSGSPLLGKIVGSTAAKFGVYRMSNSAKRVNGTMDDGTYCWQKRFGDTAQEAFETFRQELVLTARLAGESRYEDLDQRNKVVNIAYVVRWKVAFIYQDRDNVGVINIYAPDMLMHLASPYVAEVSKVCLAPLHRALINRPEASSLAFPFENSMDLMEGQPRRIHESYWLVRLDDETAQNIQRKNRIRRELISDTVFEVMQEAPLKVNDIVAFVHEDRVVTRGTIRGYNPNNLTWTQQTVNRKLKHAVDGFLKLSKGDARVYFSQKSSSGDDGERTRGVIAGVAIKSFRSIYNLELTKCQNVNVISGQNDVGKSNILRALQLFFNNQADWQKSLLFLRDFNYKRRKTSKKGQRIEVAVTFNRPDSYARSLPPTFTVTRSWDRSGQRYESHDLEKQGKKGLLPSSPGTAQSQLTRFMNNLHFEYVPAVKDRTYFEHLLEKLQTGILAAGLEQDETLGKYADNLASHIQEQLPALKSDFANATDLDTLIAPPDDPMEYFQTFRVTTRTPYGQVPLLSRGDGMQARYVSSVLNFVASKSKQTIIWGFEEPENSLEYTHCDRLADSFGEYAKTVQVFTTSHSPAFLALEEKDDCQLYRVYQEDNDTKAVRAESLDELHEELGILRIHQELHEIYEQKMTEFKQEKRAREKLQEEIDALKTPVLLTEGKTDKLILDAAWSKLYPSQTAPFAVRVADPAEGIEGGAGGASALEKMIASVHPADGKKVIAILDRDKAGFDAIKALKGNFEKWQEKCDVKVHKNGLAFTVMLPIPSFRTGPKYERKIYIENMFTDAVHAVRVDGSGLELARFDAEKLGVVKAIRNDKTMDQTTKENMVQDAIAS